MDSVRDLAGPCTPSPVFPFISWWAFDGIGFSASVGLFFGMWPAFKASRLIRLRHFGMNESIGAIIWLVSAILVAFVWTRTRRRGSRRMGGVGSAGAGMYYDMLTEDQRNAVEIIVEEKAGARDPEDRDGNLPDLTGPERRTKN